MSKGVSAVIFEGSQPTSRVEEMMVSIRHAALLDNLEKMNSVPFLENLYLHTNRPDLVEPASKLNAKVILNSIAPEKFHFGRELQKAIKNHNLDKVFCFNGAGCPLITVEELNMICSKLMQNERFVYTNNTQSVDMIAFTVPENINEVDLPAMDNSLALTLRDQLGLTMELMPHTLGLLFDIDTPSDIIILGAGPYAGRRTKTMIDSFKLDYGKLNRAKSILSDEYEDIVLIGRVGAPIIERLNSRLKLRLRVFSEERGMKALGRIEAKEVVSLLGLMLDHTGIDRFFSYLSRVGRCAFIDSRVLMYHYQLDLSDRERFLSDLGCWQEIDNLWLKEFTRAAEECSIPVILGGHSLVSGSLWALCSELAPESCLK
ncbi:MAG: hypothetical protein SCJ97_03845 [Bacillota bacterium]|nr:hypothetical protein [Bacillota bacterium]